MFGHEYLATFDERNLDECARMAGVDLDFLKKSTFIKKPSTGDSNFTRYVLKTVWSRRMPPTSVKYYAQSNSC